MCELFEIFLELSRCCLHGYITTRLQRCGLRLIFSPFLFTKIFEHLQGQILWFFKGTGEVPSFKLPKFILPPQQPLNFVF